MAALISKYIVNLSLVVLEIIYVVDMIEGLLYRYILINPNGISYSKNPSYFYSTHTRIPCIANTMTARKF